MPRPTLAAVLRKSCAVCLLMIVSACAGGTPTPAVHNPGFVSVRPSPREWSLLSEQTKDEIGANNATGEALGWWLP